MHRMIHFKYRTVLPSGPGWRLTYWTASDEPVASFWGETERHALEHAARHVCMC